MAVDIGSLPGRSAASLRVLVDRQFVGVRRLPDSVEPVSTHGDVYWRFLLRRQRLEGVCVHYQTYDAWGDENDWNLNIVPDARHSWLLDHSLLYALSQTSGAPKPVDPCEIKCYNGLQAIECELTPDDDLYGKFALTGLPISSGGAWPDKSAYKGMGPTGTTVGVYGVFCGDYGHGGRPEIHPFDAFWRRFHQPVSNAINWDLGVFQDDSNRFNSNWSKAPVDVEFRVPFCVDFPSTLTASVRQQVRFRLTRSPLCSVVGKRLGSVGGRATWSETYEGRTVRFRPRRTNLLDVVIDDETGLSDTPFDFRLDDVRLTQAGVFRGLQPQLWLSGSILVRVAVSQDGYVYWRLIGPNSTTAASAPDDPVLEEGRVAGGNPGNGGITGGADDTEHGLLPKVTMVDVSPIVDGERGRISADVVVDVEPHGAGGSARPVRHAITVGPRANPVIALDPADPTRVVEVESFDLVASARVPPGPDSAARTIERQADVLPALSQAAGLGRLGYRLAAAAATVLVGDRCSIEVETRYAPFRDGGTWGEERSMLSDAVTRAVAAMPTVTCAAGVVSGDGTSRRTEAVGTGRGRHLEADATSERRAGAPAVVTLDVPADDLVFVQATVTAADGFGLRSSVEVMTTNYRIVDAGSWLESTLDIDRAALAERRRQAEYLATKEGTDPHLRRAALLDVAADALDLLHDSPSTSGYQVAGALRLLIRVEELLGGHLRLRVAGLRKRARPP